MSKGKLDSIKLKIFRHKKLGTTIDKNQYTLSDINDLVNKIDKKSINRNEAINIYNYIAEKGKKIAELRQTKSRQKCLGIIDSSENKFDEQPDKNIPDLETEESAAERRS